MITTTVGTKPAGSEALSVEVSRQFLALFTNRFDSSIRKGDLGAWRQVSRFHFLTDDEIKESIYGLADLQRAFKLDVQNRFVIVKILESSTTETSVGDRVYQRLNAVGLKPKLYKFSDETYIYIFLSESIDSASATQRLSEWCKANLSELDLGAIRVLSNEDSIPFPLQSASSAVPGSIQSKNDLLKRFIDDAQEGITSSAYLDVLNEPSSQPNTHNDIEVAQTSSSAFWDFLRCPAPDEQTSNFTVLEAEKQSSESTFAENAIEQNLSIIAESRQSRQSHQAEHICVPGLPAAPGQLTIDATTNEYANSPFLSNSSEPAESCLAPGGKESVSRQALCNENTEITNPGQSQVVLPRHGNVQHRGRQRLAEVKPVSNLVPTQIPKRVKRSGTKLKPLKEAKQLSLKLSEQRETRAPP